MNILITCVGRRNYLVEYFRQALAGRGLVCAVALIMGAMAFSHGDKPPEAIVESRMAPYVVDAARFFASLAPHDLKEGFRRTYAQVKSAWSDALQKGIRKLPTGEMKKHEREI